MDSKQIVVQGWIGVSKKKEKKSESTGFKIQCSLQGDRQRCWVNWREALELMPSFEYSQAMCRWVSARSSDWWSRGEKEKRAKWSGLSVLGLIWHQRMDWLPDDWIDGSRPVNKRLRWSLIAHDLLVNTAGGPEWRAEKEGRIRGESYLTPGSCPPVKHLDFANWARTSGLSQRRGEGERQRQREGTLGETRWKCERSRITGQNGIEERWLQ